MKSTSLRALSVLVTALSVFLVAGLATAEETEFRFIPGGVNQAIFHSDAPLESITGSSNGVSGQVTVDLSNPGTATGQVQIDATSFRTGIDTRDEHLRSENWLDAPTYPNITFELTSVSVPEGTQLTNTQTVNAQVTGNLSIHGVTQEVTAPAEVTYYEIPESERNPQIGLSGNALRVVTSFPVRLADYNISIPPMLSLKMAEVVEVEVHLTGVDSW